MTLEQFHALELWIKAEVEARAVKSSAGPHVGEAQRVLVQRRETARSLLVRGGQ